MKERYSTPRTLAELLQYTLIMGAFMSMGALLLGTPAAAQDVIVDADGQAALPRDCDGSGSVDATVQDGIATAQDGETVFVCPGTYTENVVVSKPIILQGNYEGTAGNEGSRVATDESIIRAATDAAPVVMVQANGVTIDGFQIDAETGGGVSSVGILIGNASEGQSNVTVQNNIIENVGREQIGGSIAGGILGIDESPGSSPSVNNTIAANWMRNFAPYDETAGTQAGNAGIGLAGAFDATVTNNVTSGVAFGVWLIAQGVGDQTISGGSHTGNHRGIVVYPPAPGSGGMDYTVENMTLNGNAEYGITIFRSGPAALATGGDVDEPLTAALNNLTIENTGSFDPDASAINVSGDALGGLYSVSVSNSTISNNDNRGVNARATDDQSISIEVTQSTIESNGASPNGRGSSIIAQRGAVINVSNSIIDNGTVDADAISVQSEGSAGDNGRITVSDSQILAGSATGATQAIISNPGGNDPGFLDASGNWWGGTDPTAFAVSDGTGTGVLDITPFLSSGTDTDGSTVGFQGDFSTLNVTVLESQRGSTGRIDEAIGLADNTTRGIVRLEGSRFSENATVDRPRITIAGANQGTAGNDGSRATPESVVDGGTSTALTVTADDATVDGIQLEGTNGIVVDGTLESATGLTVQNNRFRNDQTGLSVTDVTSGSGGVTVSNNLVDLTTQFYENNPSQPTAGFNLRTIDLASPPSLSGNVFQDTDGNTFTAFYGIILDGVNGASGTNSGAATISGGTISGTAQAIAILDGEAGEGGVNTTGGQTPDESTFSISNITMNGFTGDADDVGGNASIDFHAGVFVYTGGSPTNEVTTDGTIENLDISSVGLAGNSSFSGGLYFGGFSQQYGNSNFKQRVTATNVTVRDSDSRGIFVRGDGTDATVTQSTINNVAQGDGAGDQDGISIKIEKGGTLTLTESFVRGPSTVAGDVGPVIDANNTDSSFGGGENPGPIELTISGSLLQRNLSEQSIMRTRSSAGLTPFTTDLSGNKWAGSEGPAPPPFLGIDNEDPADTDYSPFILTNTDDTDPSTDGFQGDFSTLGIDNGSPRAGPETREAEALALGGGNRLVAFQSGDNVYEELTINSTTSLVTGGPTGGPTPIEGPGPVEGSDPVFRVVDLTYNGAPSNGNLPDLEVEDIAINNGTFPEGSGDITVVNGEIVTNASSIGDSPTFELQNRFVGNQPGGNGNNAGWRLLTSPREGTTAALLEDLQQANTGTILALWNDETQEFEYVNPVDATTSLPRGESFFVYLFDRGNPIGTEASDTCTSDDACIRTSGPLNVGAAPANGFGTSTVTVGVSDTENTSSTEAGYLLGNPFAQSFDIANLTVQSTGNRIGESGIFEGAVTVYNPLTDEFTPVNADPNLDSEVAPWQGFWLLRQSSEDPLQEETLVYEEAGRTQGAPFVPAKSTMASFNSGQLFVTLGIEQGAEVVQQSRASIYAREGASTDRDAYDLARIQPMSETFAQVSFLRSNGTRASQYSVPYALEEAVDIPLHAEGVGVSGTAHISTEGWTNIPNDWELTLTDTQTGETMPLVPGESYMFSLNESDPQSTAQPEMQATGMQSGAEDADPRFIVTAGPPESLPVELAQFMGRADETSAVLAWETASETNNAGFRVQQQTDSDTYETVQFVEGAGTTDAPQSYQVRVDDLPYGTHTFRLEQVDTDGTATPSEPVEVQVRLREAMALSPVAPNPVQGQGTITMTVRDTQPVQAVLYDALGRQVRTLYQGELNGQQPKTLTIDASSLASGTYFVRVRSEASTRTTRLVVVR